ncbi:MAG: hypothetical protein MUC32_04190 [Burkholderiaceae bacterium]|nr:hypothetical protein [Burkholderiaceae bacterium]
MGAALALPGEGGDGERQRERDRPPAAHADEHALQAERHARAEHQQRELLDEVVDRVERLPGRERHADARRLERDLGALRHRDQRVEGTRRGERGERALEPGVDLPFGGGVERRPPGQHDEQAEQRGREDLRPARRAVHPRAPRRRDTSAVAFTRPP